MRKEAPNTDNSRRSFLAHVGGATAATLTASAVGIPALSLVAPKPAEAAVVGPMNAPQRVSRAYQVRHKAALNQKQQPMPAHPTNGDDEAYRNFIGSYSKALPHNNKGEVVPSAYSALVRAMNSGNPADFAAVPVAGPVKLANPQSALAFEMDGADSHHLDLLAPPAFSSEDEAAEMAEVYWQALTRDIPFTDYHINPLITQAVVDLRKFSKFSNVSVETLFRGETPGDLTGPYLSQFLWKSVPYGNMTITQKYRVATPSVDYMTSVAGWLSIQNGAASGPKSFVGNSTRYLSNGRDLAEYVHKDFTYQAFLNAALILLGFGANALDSNNPYAKTANQAGFCTFGGPHILDLVARVANCSLKAAWYQKWSVHRRLRPEEFGGRVHMHKVGAASYPIHQKLLNCQATQEVFRRYGTYLLPMAYPEGCPTHPAYPAGHATIAGACTTVLKAFFNESFVFGSNSASAPVEASSDGSTLNAYNGQMLTVGGELNKLAANIAIGRDTAGVHWRSDGIGGLLLGEAVAISVLRDYKETYNESFAGFTFTKFDGTQVTV